MTSPAQYLCLEHQTPYIYWLLAIEQIFIKGQGSKMETLQDKLADLGSAVHLVSHEVWTTTLA